MLTRFIPGRFGVLPILGNTQYGFGVSAVKAHPTITLQVTHRLASNIPRSCAVAEALALQEANNTPGWSARSTIYDGPLTSHVARFDSPAASWRFGNCLGCMRGGKSWAGRSRRTQCMENGWLRSWVADGWWMVNGWLIPYKNDGESAVWVTHGWFIHVNSICKCCKQCFCSVQSYKNGWLMDG